jgi:integrase
MLQHPLKNQAHMETVLGPTIAEWLSWGENERGWAPTTLQSYEECLARVALMFPEKRPEELTKEDLRLARDQRPPASRSWAVSIFRSFFEWLFKEERVKENVARRLDVPKRKAKKAHEIFTSGEQAQLLKNGPQTIYGRSIEQRDRVSIAILLYAGIRRSELLSLLVEDVDLIERRLIVKHGKGDKARVIPFAEDGELMRAFRFFFQTNLPILERLPQTGDHILYPFHRNQYGVSAVHPERELSFSAYHKWWGEVCKRAGVRYRSGHNARHTLLTDIVRLAGAERARLVAGHASIQTTVDTYSWLVPEDVRGTMDELEKKRQAG